MAPQPDPLADYNQIRAELALFDENLAERPEIVVVNKIDLPEAREYLELLNESLRERGVENLLEISALTRENVKRLIQCVFETAATVPQRSERPFEEDPVYELDEQDLPFELVVDGGVYYVSGDSIERAAAMTFWDYDEAVLRFHKTLEVLGVVDALAKAGVRNGDTVFIGEFELEWSD